MAFKLAEAFVELKAKGHAEVVKENEKVKESVKTIGPAADESAKRIEKSCVSMTTSFQNTGRAGTETMNKLRKEMMDTALALEKLADKEKQLNAGGGGGFGLNTNTKFGTLGKLAGIGGSVAGIVGITRAVVNRGGEMADGAKSETLGGEMGGAVANFSRGLGEVISSIKTGFVDGLLGLVSYAADYLTFGVFSKLGAAMAEEERRKNDDRRQHNDVRAFVDQERASGARLGDFDARMELRNRLNFNGGKESLEAERADLARTNAGGNIERIRMIDDELLALKQRQLQEAKKSENLNETYGAAIADAAEAARQEVAARFRNVAAIEQIGQSELQSQQGISRARQQLNEWIKRAGDKAADPNSPEGKAIAGARDRVNRIEAAEGQAEFDKENEAAGKRNRDAMKRQEEDAERKRQNDRGRQFDRALRDQLSGPTASISQMGIADLQSALQQGEIAKANEEMRRQNQDIADKANEKRDEIVKGTANIVDAVKKITGAVFQ